MAIERYAVYRGRFTKVAEAIQGMVGALEYIGLHDLSVEVRLFRAQDWQRYLFEALFPGESVKGNIGKQFSREICRQLGFGVHNQHEADSAAMAYYVHCLRAGLAPPATAA